MRNFPSNIFARLLRFAYRHAKAANVSSGAAQGYSVNSDGAVLAGYSVEYRSGSTDDRVKIGKGSVLSCRIVLERSVGTVSVGHDTYIGGSQIICADQIEIGNNVLVSWGCTIADHDSHSLDWRERAEDVRKWREGLLSGGLEKASEFKNWDVVEKAPIRIEDKVWLGMNVTVLKGVTIGEGSVVAAGSIVTKDVPSWTLVAGNPARVIKELPQE
ncbi:DapH/DapD/GlmU-related protein [Burkholderia sp. L27(2015)]|uniref:acyltransferase n=1 Tax=Burkholderia sp. L27(2015) TaxID=1641858 RepID=UPI00131B088B|nr:acyltransferase [Burkholderia sp. L27(2015)]